MFKRIALSVVLVGFIGALVWGGTVRTIAKSDQVLSVSASGHGRGQDENGLSDLDKAVAAAAGEGEACATGIDVDECDDTADCDESDDCDSAAEDYTCAADNDAALAAKGDGANQADVSGSGEGSGRNSQFVEKPEGWETVTGAVVVVPGEDIDLVIETAEGALSVGTGPNWMASQGYVLQVGEEVTIVGYGEAGEFKAGTITRASDGASIMLRDETGRPAWSGQGRRKNQ